MKRRCDLTIFNATRIIIKRADNWSTSSRLYSIEIRWDYDKLFAKYVWNNEKYSLPSPVANKLVHIDTKVVAQTCSKLGLMFKSRFEQDTTNDLYMEVWRTDLRDNKEEQRKLTLQEAFKVMSKQVQTEMFDVYGADEVVCDLEEEETSYEDALDDLIDSPVVKYETEINVTKVSSNFMDVDIEDEEEFIFEF